MGHGWRFGSLITILFLTACGSSTRGGWKTIPVPIYADSTIIKSSQSLSDLKDAFAYWEMQAGKTLFDFRGEWTGGSPYTGDPVNPSSIVANVIFFQNPWPHPPNFVGMTTVENGSNGPVAAMVMINGTSRFCNGDCNYDNRVSERKTFAHELGHFIGLGHNNDPSDIMYPDAQPGGTIKNLRADQTSLRELISGN